MLGWESKMGKSKGGQAFLSLKNNAERRADGSLFRLEKVCSKVCGEANSPGVCTTQTKDGRWGMTDDGMMDCYFVQLFGPFCKDKPCLVCLLCAYTVDMHKRFLVGGVDAKIFPI